MYGKDFFYYVLFCFIGTLGFFSPVSLKYMKPICAAVQMLEGSGYVFV